MDDKRRMRLMLAVMNSISTSLDADTVNCYTEHGYPHVSFKLKKGYALKHIRYTMHKSLHGLINTFSISLIGTPYTAFIEYKDAKWILLLSVYKTRRVHFKYSERVNHK